MPPRAGNGFTQHAAHGAAPCTSRTCAVGRRSNAHSAAPRLNGLASFRGFLPRALSNACPPTWVGPSSPRGRGRRRTKLNRTRRATFSVQRRKPAAQVLHPESCRTPSSAADPMRSLHLEESGHSTLEPRVRASTPVNGEVSPPSAERRKAFELVRFGVAITDDSQKLLILARQKN